jgi:hypothetical protein
MTFPLPSSTLRNRQDNLGGASRSASFIQSGRADDGLAGGNCQPVHNIRNDSADTPRIVICTINNGQIGFGLPFQVILSHRSSYGE